MDLQAKLKKLVAERDAARVQLRSWTEAVFRYDGAILQLEELIQEQSNADTEKETDAKVKSIDKAKAGRKS